MFDSKKRSRAPEEEEMKESGSDCKKPRTLPFRTSPTVKHTLLFSQSSRAQPRSLLTPSVTPVESSDDEDERPPPPSTARIPNQSNCVTPTNLYDVDLDMEMIDSQPPSSPPLWNDAMSTTTLTPARPSSFALLSRASSQESQNGNNGGRIPTPRWGHFHSIDTGIDVYGGTVAATHAPTCSSQVEVEHSLYLRRRRLPSPISEDENMVSQTAMTEGTMERPDMRMISVNGDPSWYLFGRGKNDIVSPASPGPKTGRAMLSMGYRADCEKCRTRVPGHYNHVIQM